MSDAIREAFEAYAEPRGLLEGTKYLPEHDAYDWPMANDPYQAWKFALQSQTAPAPPSVAVPEEILTGIRDVLRMLDEECGDTDPLCDPEDMREAYPLIWGHQQLFAILSSLAAAPQPEPLRFSDTAEEIEERLAYLDENACPHCGGSGHKDDAAQPDHIADTGKVVAELDRIRGLIAQAPIDSLGTGHNDGSCPPWPIRDEIVDGLSKIIRALPATPSVPEEEIASKAIAQFKDELVNSVKPIFRPHIEGVCAVVIDRLRTAGDDGEE